MNGLRFVLFLQPLVFALATLGRVRREERRQRRARVDSAQQGGRGAPDRRRTEGLIRASGPEELPYAFDYALGRLGVLAGQVAEERDRPLEERSTAATDESLDRVADHLDRSRRTLEAGHVDLAEMHFDRTTPIVTHLWEPDAALSTHLVEARRGFFGAV